jgi:deoxyribonuclease V
VARNHAVRHFGNVVKFVELKRRWRLRVLIGRQAMKRCDPGTHQPGSHQAERGFAAVDVHYLGGLGARAALVTSIDSKFSTLTGSKTVLVPDPGPYRSGEFYLRELPPLRAVLKEQPGLALIIVDGYVDLDPRGRPGLGAYVHAEFGAPVIGVAKTRFATATHAAQVLRGCSDRPLYVTAAGLTIADAAALVSEMAGPFRIPGALRGADRLARGMTVATA